MLKASNPMLKLGLVAVLLLCIAAAGCQQQQADAVVTGQAAKNLMFQVAEIYNSGNVELIQMAIAPNYVGHFSINDEAITGPGAFTEWVAMNRAAYSDFMVGIDKVIVDGNMICSQWTVTGTHDGPLMGLQPTGKTVRIQGLTLGRIENGRIAEEWITWDVLDMYQQLGFTVTPPTN